jgi:glutamate/aspartate transport system substrate-binding protein
MRNAIALTVMVCLLIGASAPARTQDLEGTLRKVKETGTFTIGYRESSLPLSYLDEGLQPVGFSIELHPHAVEFAIRTDAGGFADLKH